jgi:hypothetical protein
MPHSLTGMPASGTLADMNQPARLRSGPNRGNMLRQFSKVGAVAVSAMLFAVAAGAQSKSCQPAGGTPMTDLGAIDVTTTMGIATGDLKGAVGATILNIDAQIGDGTLR